MLCWAAAHDRAQHAWNGRRCGLTCVPFDEKLKRASWCPFLPLPLFFLCFFSVFSPFFLLLRFSRESLEVLLP